MSCRCVYESVSVHLSGRAAERCISSFSTPFSVHPFGLERSGSRGPLHSIHPMCSTPFRFTHPLGLAKGILGKKVGFFGDIPTSIYGHGDAWRSLRREKTYEKTPVKKAKKIVNLLARQPFESTMTVMSVFKRVVLFVYKRVDQISC